MDVLIDLDSVLNDLWVSWAAVHNARCKVCTTPLDTAVIREWDASRYVACGKAIYRFLEDGEAYATAPVMPYAQECTRALQIAGHNLYIVTASIAGNAVTAKLAWLREHFPHIAKNNVIFAHNKSMVRGDVIIDDRIENLYHHARLRILFNQPWNRNYTSGQYERLRVYPGILARAYDWVDVVRYIERLQDESNTTATAN